MIDPTQRFSARADAYARARPSYPRETIAILEREHGLSRNSVVADLGSGTGIFTALLLTSGATVHAVEPNADMRAEAERTLGGRAGFVSVAGTAEATTLAPSSVDLVTAAQAFHWFDLPRFRVELSRILRPGGRAALVWNDRDLDGTPFLREYESILRAHCPRYAELQGKSDTPAKFDEVFGAGLWSRHVAPNEQRLDRGDLVLRVMSASYAPAAGSPEAKSLATSLEAAFDRSAEDLPEGRVVRIPYTTVVIGGQRA
jgi:SAM-dependent methyltransferase